jgi:ABC-type transport system involved in cytochrome c biogenesis permease subunit|tara:strand:+ start:8272 stop:9900 length:1629 start_codon:yes stop_codon:yes gene_type:complete
MSVLIRLAVLAFIFYSPVSSRDFDISDIPVQDEGRIKPLDTFARNHLLAFYGKRSLEDGMTATDWILDLVLDPSAGKQKKIFNIRNPEVVSSILLNWSNEHKYSFDEILPGLQSQSALINAVNQKPNAVRTTFENQLIELSNNAIRFEEISYLYALKLIPPPINSETGIWLSPLEFIIEGQLLEPHQDKVLTSLQQYLSGRLASDTQIMLTAVENYKNNLDSIPEGGPDINLLMKETWMNRADLFYSSVGFYLVAFVLLGISWMVSMPWLSKLSYASLIIGLSFHIYGIFLRMLILERPPVSTIYETVIFVSFVVVTFSVIIEYFRRDGLGLFIGAVSGVIFHYIGFGYAADGDTLSMLVAVLNSNFWLATHVTTITMGYGASLVAGLVGHIYLFQVIRDPMDTKTLKSIFKNLFGLTLIALFFTLFGTILGGIWADQSWGRFWGWDPKENGALLIVLWQLMMIHMRLSGIAKPAEFALGMVLNNIIVAIAWFGVNLLQVGLHSYGFDSGVATNLFIFILLELLIGFGAYFWPKISNRFSSI